MWDCGGWEGEIQDLARPGRQYWGMAWCLNGEAQGSFLWGVENFLSKSFGSIQDSSVTCVDA